MTQAVDGRWAELERRHDLQVAVVAVVAVVAAAVRIPGMLGGLWRDEVQSHLISSLPGFREMLSFIIETESHPPLYYLLLRGLGPDAPDWLLTLPSLLFSVALVAAVYVAGKRMFGLRCGVWAAAVAAFYPVLVAYGSAARPYALLTLLNLLAVYIAWEAFRQRRTAFWLLYGGLATLLLYTHTWSLILLAAQGLALLVLAALRGVTRETVTGAAKAVLVVLALWGPWIPALLTQIDQGGHGKLYLSLGELLTRWMWVSLGGLASFGWGVTGPIASLGPDALQFLIGGLWLGLIGFFLYHAAKGLMDGPAGEADAGFLLVATAVGAVTLALALTPVSNLLVLHPMTALAPLVVVLISRGLTTVRAPVATWAFLVALLVGGSLQVWDRSNAPAVAEVVASRMPRNADLLILPESYVSSLARYDRALARRSPRTFPEHQVGRPINYRDRWVRFADTEAFVTFGDDAISALHDGREVWLTTGASLLLSEVNKQSFEPGDFDIVAAEVHELHRRLADASVTVDTIKPGFGRVETQLVVRYRPSAAAPPLPPRESAGTGLSVGVAKASQGGTREGEGPG